MASLTPLSKGLIALAVVGAMASAVWHLALKERFGVTGSPASTSPSATPVTMPGASVSTEVRTPAVPVPETSVSTSAEAPSLSATESAEQGRLLLGSGDFDRARLYLERAVQGGDGGAACHLGEMTLKGQGGIVASQDKAAALFQLAQSRNIICFATGK